MDNYAFLVPFLVHLICSVFHVPKQREEIPRGALEPWIGHINGVLLGCRQDIMARINGVIKGPGTWWWNEHFRSFWTKKKYYKNTVVPKHATVSLKTVVLKNHGFTIIGFSKPWNLTRDICILWARVTVKSQPIENIRSLCHLNTYALVGMKI